MTTDNELTVRAGNHDDGRLVSVTELIEERRKALNAEARAQGLPPTAARYRGPAFVLHVLDVMEVLADDEARAAISHAARHGARCGVVIKLYGTAEEIARRCTASALLLQAMTEGRTVQIIAPTAGAERPGPVEGVSRVRGDGLPIVLHGQSVDPPLRDGIEPGAPGYLARTVLQGNGQAAGNYLAGLVEAGLTDHIAMAFLGRELRRSADAIDPDGGLIPCPLCLASPRMRMDEIEGHLVSVHAALAEGMRR